MMKKTLTILVVLMLVVATVACKITPIKAAETNELKAEFEFINNALCVKKIDCHEMHGGKFIINYNPEVLAIETMTEEGFSSGWKILEPGKAEFNFENLMQLSGYYTWILFTVIGHGSTDVFIESVHVYDEQNTYKIEPATEITNTVYTPHRITWNEDSKSVSMGDAREEMGSAVSLESIQQYQDIAQKVVFEEGLTELNCDCFSNFSALEEVVIPSTFTSISEGAFQLAQESNENFHISGQSLSFAEKYATENGLKFEPTNEQLQGDINGNGTYEAEDALSILKMVVKLKTTYGYSADANEDGEVTAEDALKVLRKVVALE